MKKFFIVVLSLAMAACSADSKDDGNSGDPFRKPDPDELSRMSKLFVTLDGIDTSEYPIDRTFGQKQDPNEPNPTGEKMYELLKACTNSETGNQNSITRSISGTTCPISYNEISMFSKNGEVMSGQSQTKYSVSDLSYLLVGHITAFSSAGTVQFSPTTISSQSKFDFESKLQGKGRITIVLSMSSNKVTSTRTNIAQSAEAEATYQMPGVFQDIPDSSKKESKTKANTIKLKLVMTGFIEKDANGNEITTTTSSACYIDDRQFDCRQAPGLLSHSLIKNRSLRSLKM